MEYKVIQEPSIQKLELRVNQYLKQNWQLQGGVSFDKNKILSNTELYFYLQAIIKK